MATKTIKKVRLSPTAQLHLDKDNLLLRLEAAHSDNKQLMQRNTFLESEITRLLKEGQAKQDSKPHRLVEITIKDQNGRILTSRTDAMRSDSDLLQLTVQPNSIDMERNVI